MSPSPARPARGSLDLAIGALALACVSEGAWRLWPGAPPVEPPLGFVMLKAAVAALGLVAIAAHWERAAAVLTRLPVLPALLVLALASPVWSAAPAESLRDALLVTLVCLLGLGLALRFRAPDLLEMLAFAGLFAVTAQIVTAVQGLTGMIPTADSGADLAAGELGFALVAAAGAALAVPARRGLWGAGAVALLILALASGDRGSLGAAGGFLAGATLAYGATRGPLGVMGVAVALAAGLMAATLAAMFLAPGLMQDAAEAVRALGDHWVSGRGFGLEGRSLGAALGVGLGLAGAGLGGLLAVWSVWTGLRAARRLPLVLAPVLCGLTGLMMAAPGAVAADGLAVVALVAMASAAIASRLPAQAPRRPLVAPRMPGPVAPLTGAQAARMARPRLRTRI